MCHASYFHACGVYAPFYENECDVLIDDEEIKRVNPAANPNLREHHM